MSHGKGLKINIQENHIFLCKIANLQVDLSFADTQTNSNYIIFWVENTLFLRENADTIGVLNRARLTNELVCAQTYENKCFWYILIIIVEKINIAGR